MVTDLDEQYKNASLRVDFAVGNSSAADLSDYAVDIRLFNPDGTVFMSGYTIDVPTAGRAGEDVTK